MEANFRLKFSLPDNLDLTGRVKFSNNGEWVASCTTDSVVELWSVHYGRFQNALSGHKGGINDFAWSHDSLYLLTAGGDTDLKLSDLHKGRCYRAFKAHTEAPTCCDLNGNSSLMVSGSLDGTVILWDVRTAAPIRALSKHCEAIASVEFKMDGSEIMTTSYDGMCRIWDTGSGNCSKTLHTINDGKLFFAKYSRYCEQLLVAGHNTLKLWDFPEDKWVNTYSGHKSGRHFVNASFSHDGQWIISGSEDNHVYVWNVKTERIVQKLQAHEDIVMGIDCHPFRHMIVSAGIDTDNTVKIWQNKDFSLYKFYQ